MGSGASSSKYVSAATNATSEENLTAAIKGLKPADQEKLTKALANHPASKLDRELLLYDIFLECDDDRSGSLSLEEYKKLAEQGQEEGLTELFQKIDAGGVPDGKLSISEFKKYNLEAGLSLTNQQFKKQAEAWLALAKRKVVLGPEGRESLLRQVFVKCDDDNTGAIRLDEFYQLAEDHTDKLSRRLAEALFATIDASGVKDGKLSLQEFVDFNLQTGEKLDDQEFKAQACQWLQLAKERIMLGAPGRTALLKQVFNECDYDKNSRISIDEYMTLAEDEDVRMQEAMKELTSAITARKDCKEMTLQEFTEFHLEHFKSLSDAQFSKKAWLWLEMGRKRRVKMIYI